MRRNERWGSVFFTLKDPADGSCVPGSIPRRTFDGLRLDLADGERIHVYGRPELYAAKGEFRLRALSIERFGLGAHLAAIERLKQTLAAEGLFDEARKRPLPLLPRRIALVTGSDAAAKQDVLTTIQTRFPPARVLVAETLVQGQRAAAGIVEALEAVCREPEIDVVVLTRGGGSFDDLLPFSDERVVRAVAALPGADRLGGRTRAGHAALRSRRRRTRLDAYRRRQARRARPRGARRRAETRARVARALGPPGGRARARVSAGLMSPSNEVRAARSTAIAASSRCCATGSIAARCCSSSGAAPRSSTPAAGSPLSHRARRSRAATRSCAETAEC